MQAQENVCEQITVGFGFTSDWIKKWHNFFLCQSFKEIFETNSYLASKQTEHNYTSIVLPSQHLIVNFNLLKMATASVKRSIILSTLR